MQRQGLALNATGSVYDAFDNRIETVSNGVATWTLYAGSSPIMDFNGAGALTVRYLQGPTGVLARQSASGVIAWYLADRLGTIGDLIDNSGNIIDHVDFSAFGTVLAETNPSLGDRMMGFAGLERDSVTGLNLAVMRAENPGTGRWTSQDPLSFAAGDANLFRYVNNEPQIATDPTGEWFWIAIGVAIGAGVGYYQTGTLGGAIKGGIIGGIGAATGGLVGGAVGTALGGAGVGSVAAGAAAGAAGGAAGSTATQLLSTGTVSGKQLLIDTTVGAVTGGIGGALAPKPPAGTIEYPVSIPPGSSGGPTASTHIPPRIRDPWIAQNPTCAYCQTNPAVTLDHVIPQVQGGNLTPQNLIPVCRYCNSSKGPRVAPVTPPPNYQGPAYPPPWWPTGMADWWRQNYGS